MEPGLGADHLDHLVGPSRLGPHPHDVARLRLLSEAGLRLAGALDPRQVARELLDLSLGWFADAAGVYVLEHLIAEDVTPRPADATTIEVRRLAVAASGIDLEAAFPAGEVIVFTPDSPYAVCLATGRPQQFSILGQREAARLELVTDDPEVREQLLEFADYVLVPLTARGAVLGFAVFARGSKSAPFSADDIGLAEELSARAAVCVDNARRYGRERAAARALQAGLLPKTTDVVPGLEMAHRYRPAGRTALVGGDWYDVIPLSGGRVALVIGDAMGHGTAAAATMVQLRAAARTLAALDLAPDEVLTWLDRVSPSLGPAQFATCVYAVYDAADRTCAFSRAGHPPPILAGPGGDCEVLDGPPGLPLGLGDTRYATTRVSVPDGATLLLYTDGLVESRRRDLDTGTAVLRSVLSDGERDLEAACDAILGELVPEPSEDDVTLMLVRTHTARSSQNAGKGHDIEGGSVGGG
ncbi:PP2C family protein-serine/threonine phosphatase [Actinomadura sp. HBU206391]|uniref:PP2C family protein-serine/threonine phosphatase n=1 Tax=Actinomadura sp. HBU206391 TaxID=2731692 RepID=UPI001650CCDE|nr:GAF domain-containing SpoIIE family protein phosphatase [Actinomadura sp. HBU206391]MBC6460645.1 SpoIIE family protein phosphatase [Actinomadura sp. HBU206391]